MNKLLLHDRYEQVEEIGKGGSSYVYRVWDHLLKKEWAMKVVEKNANNVIKNSFHKEIYILTKLSHKGIPSIIDTFEDETSIYAVMEIVKGKPIDVYVREKKSVQLLGYMYQVLEILQYLHKQSILYLDLKPQNIMIDEYDAVWLIDFGSCCFYFERDKVMTGTPRICSKRNFGRKDCRLY